MPSIHPNKLPILPKRKPRERLAILFYWLVLLFPLFWGLENLPLLCWDESRLAESALEMLDTGNIWVMKFNAQPDYYSPKPPLVIWLQGIAFTIFGKSVWVLRLPSVLAAFATAFVLWWYGRRDVHSPIAGYLAPVIVLLSSGYAGYHIARTGDYDAILTLFNTLAALAFFLFLEEGRIRTLIVFSFALSLALLTKGIAATLYLPAMAGFGIVAYPVKRCLNFRVVLAFAIPFGLLGAYYLYRDSLLPGYINAVWLSELGGRFAGSIDSHREPFWFYLKGWLDWRFYPFIWLYLPALLVILKFGMGRVKRLGIYLLVLTLFYTLVISVAATKLFWYDASFYPLAALLIALGAETAWNLRINNIRNYKFKQWALLLLLVMCLLRNYRNNIRTALDADDNDHHTRFLAYVQQELALNSEKGKPINAIYATYHGALLTWARYMASPNSLVYWGTLALKPEDDSSIKLLSDFSGKEQPKAQFPDSFKPNDVIILADDAVLAQIASKFKVISVKEGNYGCKTVRLGNRN